MLLSVNLAGLLIRNISCRKYIESVSQKMLGKNKYSTIFTYLRLSHVWNLKQQLQVLRIVNVFFVTSVTLTIVLNILLKIEMSSFYMKIDK